VDEEILAPYRNLWESENQASGRAISKILLANGPGHVRDLDQMRVSAVDLAATVTALPDWNEQQRALNASRQRP